MPRIYPLFSIFWDKIYRKSSCVTEKAEQPARLAISHSKPCEAAGTWCVLAKRETRLVPLRAERSGREIAEGYGQSRRRPLFTCTRHLAFEG